MPPRTILIADDDVGMVRLLKTVLEPLGAQIRHAHDAFSALADIRETPPDLAILDIHMPAGNGLSVCEMLATDSALSRISVIVITGESDDNARLRCRSAGAHFVLKGADAVDQIKQLVRQIFQDLGPANIKSQLFIG